MTAPEHARPAWTSTLRVRAEVLVAGGRLLTGDLHLLANAPLHAGPETPEDVLNRDEAFFPLTEDAGPTLILAKRHVLAVGLVADSPAEDPDRLLAARTIELRVELSDGSEFAGTVTSELPPSRRRALDLLNHRGGFFALHSPGALRLLNRDHVRIVTPLD